MANTKYLILFPPKIRKEKGPIQEECKVPIWGIYFPLVKCCSDLSFSTGVLEGIISVFTLSFMVDY